MMERLYLPGKNTERITERRQFLGETRDVFQKRCGDLENRAHEMAKKYLDSSTSVSQNDVKGLAVDTYKLTIEMFDKKLAMGETLYPEEQQIYELCKREVQKAESETEESLKSIWGVLFNAIERIRDCIDEIKDWFGLSSEEDKAGLRLVEAGNVILPAYGTLVEGFFTNIAEFFADTFTPTILGIAEAQAQCALLYQQQRTTDRPFASTMLDIADYAYNGHEESQPENYSKLTKNELPDNIRILYNEQNGLLKSSRGLKVWLGKKNNTIVVSYSGTDSIEMLYADAIQLSSPSTLYLKGAGLLKLMLDYIPNKTFFVTGHSLGGGLMQFALTANMNLYYNRLQGYGYNPAGLSMISLFHLENSRLRKAMEKVWIFMTCYDPISTFGGKIGCLTTLPKTNANGHGMADLKVCMKKYLENPVPITIKPIMIVMRNHLNDSDFIPYSKKLSIKDQNGIIYPIFNNNGESAATDFIHVNTPESLFQMLNIPATTVSSCLGVYNKFNGTAHTVINRMLLFAMNEPVVTATSAGNIQSSIIYGKFGLGIKELIPEMEKLYADSGEMFGISRTAYEKAFSILRNNFAYDKDAWCTGILLQFKLDMRAIFAQYDNAESYFNSFLVKFISDRSDLYRSIYNGKAPTDSDIKMFLKQLKVIALKDCDHLMDQAVNYGVINKDKRADYHNQIESFCDRVIGNI